MNCNWSVPAELAWHTAMTSFVGIFLTLKKKITSAALFLCMAQLGGGGGKSDAYELSRKTNRETKTYFPLPLCGVLPGMLALTPQKLFELPSLATPTNTQGLNAEDH